MRRIHLRCQPGRAVPPPLAGSRAARSVDDASAMLRAVGQQVRFACRSLWRARTFACTAVLTLALGIAGTTTMFALVQSVLLRPLAVHEQSRVIIAWKEVRTSASARYPFGHAEIEAVAKASRLLARIAGVTRNGAAVRR